jgi:general stress protein 26
MTGFMQLCKTIFIFLKLVGMNVAKDKMPAITILKKWVREIKTCLFCTNLKTNDGASCRPMSPIKVCDQGNLWFFSEINSLKNIEIRKNKNIQLFFSSPVKNSYLVINGYAEIITDRAKIENLWTPEAGTWFKEGITDPAISIIMVIPTNGYYWDNDNNNMVNFLRTAPAMNNETRLVTGREGLLSF